MYLWLLVSVMQMFSDSFGLGFSPLRAGETLKLLIFLGATPMRKALYKLKLLESLLD